MRRRRSFFVRIYRKLICIFVYYWRWMSGLSNIDISCRVGGLGGDFVRLF
jgi:hypothetical protein